MNDLSSEERIALLEVAVHRGAVVERENAKLRQQLERAQKAVDPLDASVLRSILNNWRGCDSLVLAAPMGLANQLLVVLDAMVIVHGTEEECRRVDAMLERVFDTESRRP